jgi:hypothetical protein
VNAGCNVLAAVVGTSIAMVPHVIDNVMQIDAHIVGCCFCFEVFAVCAE